MKVFISYSRDDEGAVRSLVGDLQRAPVQVWLDEEIGGGAAWWTAILNEIRECTVFLFAVSNNSLNSKPCRAERGYAEALGLPILPVQVGEISSFLDDPIFIRQVIDYRKPTSATGFALMGALNEQAAQRADLPDSLPDAPPIPYEYLRRLGPSIRDPAILTLPVQDQMLFELRNALHDEDDPTVLDEIRNLLRALRRRTDVTYPIASQIDTILGKDVPEFGQTPAESRPENAVTVGGQRPDTLAPAAAPASPPADAPSESAASRVASYWKKHRLLLGVLAVILGVGFAWAVASVVHPFDGNAWTPIPGALKQLSVGNASTIWGVNASDMIYRWNGNDWTQVEGSFKYVSVGSDGTVWGVNASDNIYRRTGNTWTPIPGALKQLSVGNASTIWGVNASDMIYRWNGNDWTQVEGSFKHVSVGSDGTVWGVNASDNIYRRTGNTWTPIPGALKQLSVGNASTIWGVNASDMIYRWNGNDWTQVEGSFKHVSVASDGTVWVVNASDNIYRR